ncbi:MAG: nuclear transport factor 2 family protein [Pseudomonadota bacterium]
MSQFQDAKAVVSAHYAALATATQETVAEALSQHTTPDWHWRGMHPFHEQHGAKAVATSFYIPFLQAFSRVQRRQDLFFAGQNDCDDGASIWVGSMGHMMGLFDTPFLGIRPTRRIAMVRYASFDHVKNGKIVETSLFIDLLHLMMQAGQYPLPPQTGAHLVQPGPMTHDGLLYHDADNVESTKTLTLINRMIGDINAHQKYKTRQEELSQCWHDDMLWWGPAGIGATYTIDRYIDQHQAPFRTYIKDRVFNGHICRIAEGNFGGFFGWANLTVTNVGGYMGLPAGSPADMRVVDMYRRDGDKLAENWIFIDMLHWLNQQGLDVLARLEET